MVKRIECTCYNADKIERMNKYTKNDRRGNNYAQEISKNRLKTSM